MAEALGYSNSRDAIAVHVDTEDKATVAIYDGSQNRNMTIINESGLYSPLFAMQPQKSNNGGVSDAYPIDTLGPQMAK